MSRRTKVIFAVLSLAVGSGIVLSAHLGKNLVEMFASAVWGS